MPLNDLPRLGKLTPDNQGLMVEHLKRLVYEAVTGAQQWYDQVDHNRTIYQWGSDPAPTSIDDVVINNIQNHVISSVDIQTREAPQVSLDPVETGEPADVYWAGPEEIGIAMFHLDVMYTSENVDPNTGASQPPQPVPELVGDAMGQAVADGAITPVGVKIKDTWVVEVNDRLVAEVYQSLYDLFARRSRFDSFVAKNVLWTNVDGFCYGLYEFDDESKRHIFRRLPCKQVYIDPTIEEIDDAAYAGFDLPMDADEAMKTYPLISDAIAKNATIGQPQPPDNMMQWGEQYLRDFKRNMVVLRVFWLANQLVPMQLEEAVAFKLVEERQVPDEEAIQEQQQAALAQAAQGEATAGDANYLQSGGAGEYGGDGTGGDSGNDTLPSDGNDSKSEVGAGGISDGDGANQESGVRDNEESGVGEDDGNVDAEGTDTAALPAETQPQAGSDQVSGGSSGSGMDAGAVALPDVPTRTACFLCGTDLEVSPDHDNWPLRRGIRQVTVVADQVVDDRESEHPVIPLLQNTNIPVLGQPYGQGEPDRLIGQQRAHTRMMAAVAKHADFFGSPAAFMSQSMFDSLGAEEKEKMFIEPGMLVVVPDVQWTAMGGKPTSIIDPPQTPAALIEGIQLFDESIDKSSGHAPVLQGITEPGVKSGRAIANLQSAASSVISFKSSTTQQMVMRAAILQLHSLVWRLDIEDFLRVISKYPRHIAEAIMKRAKRLEWDVSVTISSGNGAVKMQKKQEALNDLEVGAITMQTYREVAGIDHRQEEQRTQAVLRQAVPQQPGQAGPPQPGQPQPNHQTRQPQQPGRAA